MLSSKSPTANHQSPITSHQPPISVIIPTLNNTKGLVYLLKTFGKTPYPIVIIDNQPSSEKHKLVNSLTRKINNKLIYLPQKTNIGFASAINRGAELAKTEWILILNDDVEFPVAITRHAVIPDLFQDLIDYANKNHWSSISPVLKNTKGIVENYGYRVLPYGKIKLNLQPPTTNRQSPITSHQPPIDGLTAACLLIKTNVFKQLKGFDESFFAYLEDVDLFLRVKKSHFSFGICEDISVIHNHLATSITLKGFKQKQDFKNWIKLIYKHPKYFHFNDFNLFLERLRNISGYIKSIK